MSAPTLTPLGDRLFVLWQQDGESFEFHRFHDGREGISAEVNVVVEALGALHWSRLNLASSQARRSVAGALEERDPRGHWAAHLERSCRLVAEHVRRGEPSVPLQAEAPAADAWVMPGLIQAGQLTVLFGDGGASKSLTSLAWAVSGILGRAWAPRMGVTGVTRVLYLDWEADRATHAARLWGLTQGVEQVPEGAIRYRRCYRPLTDLAEGVRQEIAEHRVDFVIADSLGGAGGPEPESNDAAVRTIMALRSFQPATQLAVAHVSKQALESKGPARPFGGVYVQNLARSTIEARAEPGEDSALTVSYFHRKCNSGPLVAPLALTYRFEPDGRITLSSGTADYGGAPLPQQIIKALRAGKQDADALAEQLGANVRTIKSALSRLDQHGKVIRLESVSGGRGNKALWGLKEKTDDDRFGN